MAFCWLALFSLLVGFDSVGPYNWLVCYRGGLTCLQRFLLPQQSWTIWKLWFSLVTSTLYAIKFNVGLNIDFHLDFADLSRVRIFVFLIWIFNDVMTSVLSQINYTLLYTVITLLTAYINYAIILSPACRIVVNPLSPLNLLTSRHSPLSSAGFQKSYISMGWHGDSVEYWIVIIITFTCCYFSFFFKLKV